LALSATRKPEFNLEPTLNIDLFKAQATRLGKYLSEKHRLSLSRSAQLEAIACLHGAKDWNSLSAAHSAPYGLVLGTPTTGLRRRPVVMSEDDLMSHVLLTHTPGAGYMPFLENLVKQHARQGGQFVWVSARFGVGDARELVNDIPELTPDSVNFVLPGLRETKTVNLIRDAGPHLDWLAPILPPKDTPGARFYAEACESLVAAVLPALRLTKEESISSLLQVLQSTEGLTNLLDKVPSHLPEHEALARVLMRYRTPNGVMGDMSRVACTATSRICALLGDESAPYALAEDPSLNLIDSILEGNNTVIGLRGLSETISLAPLVLAHVKEALRASSRSVKRRSVPLMLILDEVLRPGTRDVIDQIASQARSTRAGLIVVNEIPLEGKLPDLIRIDQMASRMTFERGDGEFFLKLPGREVTKLLHLPGTLG
jgi:hypothetical protein